MRVVTPNSTVPILLVYRFKDLYSHLIPSEVMLLRRKRERSTLERSEEGQRKSMEGRDGTLMSVKVDQKDGWERGRES